MREKTADLGLAEKEGASHVLRKKRWSVDFWDEFGNDVSFICERQDQSMLFATLTHYADYAVWHMLKSQISIKTKVCHVSRSEMARLLNMRKATFLDSVSRMCAASLCLPFEPDAGIPGGIVLNPALVTVGDHADAWARWLTACDQASERGDANAGAARSFYDKWFAAKMRKR